MRVRGMIGLVTSDIDIRPLAEGDVEGALGLSAASGWNQRAADWHARERARLEATGTPPPLADGQIAAIAATNDLLLVTRNVEDFRVQRPGRADVVVTCRAAVPRRLTS